MKIGACAGTSADGVKLLKDIGFKYIEIGLRGVYGDNAGELAPFMDALGKNGILCEAANCPFPGNYNPSGEQSKDDLEQTREAFYDLISKTSALKIDSLIIGAGGARVLPSPELYDNAMAQMATIARECMSPVAAEFGITVVLEGLNKGESAMLNTTAQSVDLSKMSGCDNIKVMADLYHVWLENEVYSDFANYKGYIKHAHIANPDPRIMPDPEDGFDYKPFFDALRLADFEGRISAEAGTRGDYKTAMEKAYELIAKYA